MPDGNPLRSSLLDTAVIGGLARALLARLRRVVDGYNRLRRADGYAPPTDLPEFQEVRRRSREPNDLSDHLERLFVEALEVSPDTIVELGVRGGQSTFVFERVARLAGSNLVSVDVEDTSYATEYDGWHFVRSDDVEFAERFESWCGDADVDPDIDVLFVDTSHVYAHTVAEIDAWFPYLSDDAVVLFHDTNMGWLYRREDGTVGLGLDNDRGVIRAIEEQLGCSLDETESFVTIESGFVLKQYPLCSGLTVLRKLGPEAEA